MLKAFKIIRISVIIGSLLSTGLLRAQAIYATVTATVTDPNGHPLAAAQINAILVDAMGRQITSATSPNGQIVSSIVKPGVLTANGSFSIQLLETSTLSKPSGTQWQITISQPPLDTQAYILTYQPPWTISYTTPVTGNVDLSSQLTALTAPIQFVNLKTGQNTLVSGASANALTGATSGGAAPGSTFNGSAAVTFDYHTFGAGGLAASNAWSGTNTFPTQPCSTISASPTLVATMGAVPCAFDGVTLTGTPSSGQVPTATGPTTATWQTAVSGGVTSFTGDGTVYNNVASTGAVTGTLATHAANTFLAGPCSGSAANPTFRGLCAADVPAGSGLYVQTAPSGSQQIAMPSNTQTCFGTITAGVCSATSINNNTIFPGIYQNSAAGINNNLASTYFLQNSGFVPSTNATSGANQSSPQWLAQGYYWNGTSSAADAFIWQNIIGTGTNPTATLTLSHNATTTSSQKVSIPFLTDLGAGSTVNGVAIGTGSGTVTSVTLTVPSRQTVTGSPCTTNCTLGITDNAQAVNTVFAGPASGSSAVPTFRGLVSADIPNNAANTSGNAATATALAATPTLCSSGYAPVGITANGNATGCAAIGGSPASLTCTYTASGTTTFAAASYVIAGCGFTATHSTSTTFNPTGLVFDGSYTAFIKQDSTGGGNTFTLGTSGSCATWRTPGGAGAVTTLTLSTVANERDVLTFTYDGTDCYITQGTAY